MKIGFPALLGLLFIGLKLGHVIAWSWWLVLLPLYAVLAIALTAMVLVVAFAVLAGVLAVVLERSTGDRQRDSRSGLGRIRTK